MLDVRVVSGYLVGKEFRAAFYRVDLWVYGEYIQPTSTKCCGLRGLWSDFGQIDLKECTFQQVKVYADFTHLNKNCILFSEPTFLSPPVFRTEHQDYTQIYDNCERKIKLKMQLCAKELAVGLILRFGFKTKVTFLVLFAVLRCQVTKRCFRLPCFQETWIFFTSSLRAF